ncbi:NUDIX hydrolase [Cloacibacterium sp.]|jgi:ADP-ribose pyrophosphatase YjhB (NUDIX family)|uniref:NUDIX hydrolase n=1 Tax=Cloacibacterium sp. TaxID=1913682 RepID=UPI0035B0B364
MIDKINIRVYAIYVNENQELMALDEGYAGKKLVKLPGGGLEFGEGTLECLHREFAEELNLKIEVLEHFYTQEEFLASMFRENEQLLTIYYTVNILNFDELRILDESIENVKWISLQEENPLPLPIDKIVFEKLKEKLL